MHDISSNEEKEGRDAAPYVMAPTDTKSTFVAAIAAIVCSVTLPDASVGTRPVGFAHIRMATANETRHDLESKLHRYKD